MYCLLQFPFISLSGCIGVFLLIYCRILLLQLFIYFFIKENLVHRHVNNVIRQVRKGEAAFGFVLA